MSYPNERRVWLDKGPFSKDDVLKADPPPSWSQADEREFRRYWSRKHVSSPSMEDREAAMIAKARAEAQAMTTAEQWQAELGITLDKTPPKLNAEQAAAYYSVIGKKPQETSK